MGKKQSVDGIVRSLKKQGFDARKAFVIRQGEKRTAIEIGLEKLGATAEIVFSEQNIRDRHIVVVTSKRAPLKENPKEIEKVIRANIDRALDKFFGLAV